MDNFLDILFPPDIAYNSSGGPSFSTIIASLQNKLECRTLKWLTPLYRYKITYNSLDNKRLNDLISFFITVKGRAYSFRYRDWLDYQAKNENIGSGDGIKKDFQLVKTYKGGKYKTERHITKPVLDSVRIFSSADLPAYIVDHSSGVISFSMPPLQNCQLFADFTFDVETRFDCDNLMVAIAAKDRFLPGEIDLVEVINQ